MTTLGALQVEQPCLVAQQELPVDTAILPALALGAADAVVALRAAEPGPASPISGGINRKHGRPPDPAALQRLPSRRRFAAVRRPGRSTASRRRDLPRPALPAGPSPPRSPPA